MAGWLFACGPLRVHTYLIPAKIEPGWITIEYDNPKCAPLSENVLGREYVIPQSGFLCTSSPIYTGWYRERYYSVDENNNRILLEPNKIIHRQQSFYVNKGSLTTGTSCKVSGTEFFYGPKEKLTWENPIMNDENFLKVHPECGQQGEKVTVK